MPLDKMPNPEEFVPTHKSMVLHIQKNPVSCIIDPNSKLSDFESLLDNPHVKAKLVGFLNKDEEIGLLIGFKLIISSEDKSFEYTVYPNEQLIDTLIFNDIICIINSEMDQLFSLKINTDQFVKTKSEFDKFQNMLK
ncbi:hypothetical protein [Nitrosopumilus sp.]|uniref:hypothetical protein n=1 Tax=Nitrosopumilus sp. TaxID=2024843 RepID=UPI00260586F9|nr:hypothetical protein [Nitrosopumilus sp.]